jgi:hypothetical protein
MSWMRRNEVVFLAAAHDAAERFEHPDVAPPGSKGEVSREHHAAGWISEAESDRLYRPGPISGRALAAASSAITSRQNEMASMRLLSASRAYSGEADYDSGMMPISIPA